MRLVGAAIFAAVMIFSASIRGAAASDQPICAGSPLVEIDSVEKLPQEIIQLLAHYKNGGAERVSDRGGKFNSTDLGPGPRRRFALAGVAENCAIVAVEQGGIGYSVGIFSFERADNGWQLVGRGVMFTVPRTLREMVEHAGK